MDSHEHTVLKLLMAGILVAPSLRPIFLRTTGVNSVADPAADAAVDWGRRQTQLQTVNVWMMRGLSATDSLSTEPSHTWTRKTCNESHLQLEVESCGEEFKRAMAHIDPQYWCNLTHFIREYHVFTLCTENKSQIVHCYWPNPLVESYIIRVHKHFFSNCTIEHVVLVDPPDDTLTILILIPVFLTMAMISLVVWCSKKSDILA